MITDLAGLPAEMDLDLHAWAQDYFALNYGAPELTDEQERAITGRATAMIAFLTEFVQQRRAYPRDDLVSNLVEARTTEGDPSLDTAEVIGVLNSLFVAGVETTAIFVPMFLRLLQQRPDQWRAVNEDRSLLPAAIEEGLRHQPTARGVRRTTTRAVEIGGVRIPEGRDIFLTYASANFDAEVFPDPDLFDIHRTRTDRHLTFGKGTHFCIGAPLARLQTRVAVEAVMDRLPNLRLIDERIDWRPHMTLPRPAQVRFAWDVPPTAAASRRAEETA
jgi:cytochrome P450